VNAEPNALTEAELLAAPEADYMSPRQLAFFEKRLRAMREELSARQSATLRTLVGEEPPLDPMDRATLEEQHFIELRLREREAQLLQKVDAALLRIRSGEYGYCTRTGEPIGLPRLLARPTATRLVRPERTAKAA
jgi:DnaK suppressor protein